MKQGLGTSLRHKVTWVVLTTTGVARMRSATPRRVYELRSYSLTWTNDLKTQADIIAHASAPALQFNDSKAASESLAMLKLRPQIVAAAVYRSDRQLFASFTNPADPGEPVPLRAGAAGYTIEGDRLELFQPIRENGEVLGSVYLRAHYEITTRLFDYLLILAAVMLTSLIVAALVLTRLQRTITAPILGVARAARKVMHSRDFSLRATKTTDDEVGTLVDAFNDMLAEVGERTAALERSNQQLSLEMAERRKAEAALTDAARTKDEFLATLAHELRNPLAPISNAVELLKREGPGAQAMHPRALQIMERQVQQMVRLIDDLLDVSRITTGKVLIHKEPVDLLAVLHSSIEIAAPNVQARGHQLTLELPSGPVFVLADAVRLAQVFANLLNNAAKYTDSGGRIGLRLETQPDAVIVRVADSGVGIDPAMQSSIFDMFVQVDQSLEKGRAGLGVGLTLARQLIELHGGRITVRSAGIGSGSEFAVWLPRGDAVQPPAPEAVAASAPASGTRRRILVADDNVDFATSLAHLLEGMGHDVTVTHDGASALEVAGVLRPQFSFLDIGMPGLNGYELAGLLRRNKDTSGAVLVAITGWGQAKDRERARASGFDHHLVKPVEVAQLEQILNASTV